MVFGTISTSSFNTDEEMTVNVIQASKSGSVSTGSKLMGRSPSN